MNNMQAEDLFTELWCPHCKERVVIPMDAPFNEFTGFENTPGLSASCMRFNDELNERFGQFLAGNLTKQDFDAWAEPYRR